MGTHMVYTLTECGQSAAAARGAHIGINLHPAEICEAERLRGG